MMTQPSDTTLRKPVVVLEEATPETSSGFFHTSIDDFYSFPIIPKLNLQEVKSTPTHYCDFCGKLMFITEDAAPCREHTYHKECYLKQPRNIPEVEYDGHRILKCWYCPDQIEQEEEKVKEEKVKEYVVVHNNKQIFVKVIKSSFPSSHGIVFARRHVPPPKPSLFHCFFPWFHRNRVYQM